MSGRKRHAAAFCGSLFAHLLLAALFAVLGVFTANAPPSLALEVSFAGSPGGGGGAPAPVLRAAAGLPPPAPDDIAEEIKTQQPPPATPPAARPPKDAGAPADGNDKNNTAGQGAGGDAGGGKTPGGGRGGQGGGGGQGAQSALPRMLYYKEPNYPSSAIAAGAQGTVHIRLAVSVRGAVESVSLEKSSGWREIDASVLTAAKQWRFSPAKDARGRSMACYVDLPVNFRLRK
ncbi:MAG: energy transducer TonB [Acidaminococcales bacterium]|jgi:protein TonB|nr:energy transducer TonB [Acidaminococcales bacterium]